MINYIGCPETFTWLLLEDMPGQIKLGFMTNILHNKVTEARLSQRVSLPQSTKFYLLCLILQELLFINRHL